MSHIRTYIRHPTDIPIQLKPAEDHDEQQELYQMKDISHGGLRCMYGEFIEPGAYINLQLPIVKPVFETVGKVMWCKKSDEAYEIGIEFLRSDDIQKARMVEQICHIEHYRKSLVEKEGREITSAEAAMEWIDKFAAEFPQVK
ncbi:MAG: PilZ domain-containing protein [Planctomycetes bacterium]|nr:PilZ domain-containing protein [Planctomycetota bacterium]